MRLEPSQAAARVLDSAIREALLEGLDAWMQLKPASDGGRAWLKAVADGADDSAWRRAFRKAALAGDTKQLQALAGQAEALAQPPSVLARLGSALDAAGLGNEADSILRQAQARYPGDFWINYNLGHFLIFGPTSHHPDKAVGYFRAAVAIRPSSAEARSILGLALFENGDADAAIAAYRQAIALAPEFAIAHDNLGSALRDQGKLDDAIACYKKASELDQKLAPAHASLGSCYAQLGRWDEAAAEFDRGLELDPSDYYRWCLAAALRAALGDLAGYRRTCQKMLERFGDTDQPQPAERMAKACLLLPDALGAADSDRVQKLALRALTGTENDRLYYWFVLAKGLADYRAGRHAEAVQWLKRFPPNADGNHWDATKFAVLAMAQHGLGRAEEAWASLANAEWIIAKMPDPTKGQPFEAVNWHDWVHAQVLCREAEAECGKAFEPDAKTAVAHYKRGLALYRQGTLDEAVAEWRKVVELEPRFALVHASLGGALADQGKRDEAAAEYRKAIELDPGSANVCNNRAWHLATDPEPRRRDGLLAVTLAQLAVKAAPTNGNYWNTLGAAHYRAEDWNEAVAALEKSMELRQGGDGSDWFFLAMAHWQLGDREPARKWYAAAALWMDKHAPGDAQLRRFRDEAAALLGAAAKDPELSSGEADVEIWTLVLEAQPDSVPARRRRGDAYGARGEWASAIADYTKAIELDPKDASAWNNRGVAHARVKQWDEADADVSKALELQPDTPLFQNNVAWRLAARPETQKRDPRRAVELAEKAVKAEPANGFFRVTLGVARYRAGDAGGAVAALEEAQKEIDAKNDIKSGAGRLLFFLAMAEQKAGHGPEAKQAYERALEWLKANQPALEKNPWAADEMARFRAEAEEVLGVTPPEPPAR
jgi:tetratricopeptide (TPR) repeat protein